MAPASSLSARSSSNSVSCWESGSDIPAVARRGLSLSILQQYWISRHKNRPFRTTFHGSKKFVKNHVVAFEILEGSQQASPSHDRHGPLWPDRFPIVYFGVSTVLMSAPRDSSRSVPCLLSKLPLFIHLTVRRRVKTCGPI